jgi:hypothetical protein
MDRTNTLPAPASNREAAAIPIELRAAAAGTAARAHYAHRFGT